MRRRVLGLLGVLLAFVPMSATSAVAADRPGVPIVVLGIAGLRWDDLSPSTTPTMWALAQRGATGALVVRSVDEVSSPLDGWATLSAGNRARGGVSRADIQRRNRGTLTGAEVGAFGSALRVAGTCARSEGGPGAALAAADRNGAPTATRTQTCPVLFIEIDSLAAENRGAGLAAADRSVLAAIDRIPNTATVLLLGLSDSASGSDSAGASGSASGARLHVAIATGPGFPAGARLRSASTRRAPFVQLVDVAPTVLQRLRIARPDSMIGQAFAAVGPRRVELAGRQSAYVELDRQATQMHRAVPLFFIPLAIVVVLGLALVAALHASGRRTTARRVAVAGLIPLAATPGGSFLANLAPWWRGPVWLIWPAVAAGAALVLTVAVLLSRRREPLTVIGMTAAVTLAILAVDLLTGGRLQLSSVLGYDPLIAGRFTGIGNPAFGVLAAAALVTALLFARSWRWVLMIAAVAVIIDGAPMWGSDVGGVLALVPGMLVLAAAASGRRVSWRAVLGGLCVAVLALVIFAAADLARPAGARTHLGRFVSDLAHGHGGTTVHRKLVANWELLTRSPATMIVPFLLAGLALIAVRAGAIRGTAGLAAAYQHMPLLRPGLIACVVTAVAGFLLNDSGVVIPAVMTLIVLPVAVVAATEQRFSTAPISRQPTEPVSGKVAT